MCEKTNEVEILATCEEEAALAENAARLSGMEVVGRKIWNGPTPPYGSFTDLGTGVCMSTPEYFFLRMANQLPLADAVRVGMELCGKYVTRDTARSMDEGEYEFIVEPRTNKDILKAYIGQVIDTEEGKRAARVLDTIVDGSASPMATYLYMLACMPREHGGAGLPKADVSAVYWTPEDGFTPSSDGAYIAYDLCWRDSGIAIQYVSRDVSGRDVKSLEANGIDVIFVTREAIENDWYMRNVIGDLVSRRVIGKSVDDFEPFGKESVPKYDHMEMTAEDIAEHAQKS